MSSAHQRAQELASRAGLARREGNRGMARRLFSEAADLEGEELFRTSKDRVRTRSILAVSYVSMLYKSARYADAEHAIYQLMAGGDLMEFAEVQLRDLLESVFDEQSLPEGYEYSGDELEFALRGGQVGFGTAPFDLILQTGTGLRNYVTRMTEFTGGFPFRPRGAAPNEVQRALQTRATVPQSGSYRLSLRIVEPSQTVLFPEPKSVQPRRAIDTALEVMRLAAGGTSASHQRLQEVVPDRQYRKAFLGILRNLAPTGRQAESLEVRRVGADADPYDRVYFTKASGEKMKDLLLYEEPQEASERVVHVDGVLRALHLDKRWLELALPDGKRLRYRTPKDALDDVIGPMVNRKVRATGRRRGKQTKLEFDLLDIEVLD